MAKFRKKPVVIEAFRLNERGLIGEDWFWDAVTRNDIVTHCFGKHEPDPAWCEIKTLEGTMIANAGDYIIRGVHGEIYPCKADIFQKIYTEDKPKTNAVTVQEWISVKDRLPEEKVNCIVHYRHAYCDDDDYWAIGICFYDGEKFQINPAYKVTHWMPMPNPPKGE